MYGTAMLRTYRWRLEEIGLALLGDYHFLIMEESESGPPLAFNVQCDALNADARLSHCSLNIVH
jgi:hypothetical protein